MQNRMWLSSLLATAKMLPVPSSRLAGRSGPSAFTRPSACHSLHQRWWATARQIHRQAGVVDLRFRSHGCWQEAILHGLTEIFWVTCSAAQLLSVVDKNPVGPPANTEGAAHEERHVHQQPSFPAGDRLLQRHQPRLPADTHSLQRYVGC